MMVVLASEVCTGEKAGEYQEWERKGREEESKSDDWGSFGKKERRLRSSFSSRRCKLLRSTSCGLSMYDDEEREKEKGRGSLPMMESCT